MNEPTTPHVFISYSHDHQAHKDWVRHLAEKLQRHGVETILDQWDLGLGGDLPSFMEKGLANATRILVICTDKYVKKANEGDGGAGYEKMILTAHMMGDLNSKSVIPVIRQRLELRLERGLAPLQLLDLAQRGLLLAGALHLRRLT